MGIYSDGNIYGVGWRIYDKSDNLIQEYEKKFPAKMTLENIQEVKKDFDLLTEEQKSTISIYFLTMISTTYNLGLSPPDSAENRPCLSRWPGDIIRLQELFETGDTVV